MTEHNTHFMYKILLDTGAILLSSIIDIIKDLKLYLHKSMLEEEKKQTS
jgi:hypothetical protein